MANIDNPAKVVLVTSTLPGEGKTGFATSYAISVALEGRVSWWWTSTCGSRR